MGRNVNKRDVARISHLSFLKEIHSQLAILRLKLVRKYDRSEETTMNRIAAQGNATRFR